MLSRPIGFRPTTSWASASTAALRASFIDQGTRVACPIPSIPSFVRSCNVTNTVAGGLSVLSVEAPGSRGTATTCVIKSWILDISGSAAECSLALVVT